MVGFQQKSLRISRNPHSSAVLVPMQFPCLHLPQWRSRSLTLPEQAPSSSPSMRLLSAAQVHRAGRPRKGAWLDAHRDSAAEDYLGSNQNGVSSDRLKERRSTVQIISGAFQGGCGLAYELIGSGRFCISTTNNGSCPGRRVSDLRICSNWGPRC